MTNPLAMFVRTWREANSIEDIATLLFMVVISIFCGLILLALIAVGLAFSYAIVVGVFRLLFGGW